jgi:hypothetical protein
MTFGCSEALVSITLCPVDSIRCPVTVKFLKKTGAVHNGKNDNTNIVILQRVKIIFDVILFVCGVC